MFIRIRYRTGVHSTHLNLNFCFLSNIILYFDVALNIGRNAAVDMMRMQMLRELSDDS